MMENVLGVYGPVQSEWFTILIDEYGYGVHDQKHSTLYTLRSVGLNTEPHHYWEYCRASALAANNYFHHLGSERRFFFHHVGALIHSEAGPVDFCRRAVSVPADVFDGECDDGYRTIMSNFDVQFPAQIEWTDGKEAMSKLHCHCHNQDELCHIVAGQMDFFSSPDSHVILNPGDGARSRRSPFVFVRVGDRLTLADPAIENSYRLPTLKWE